MLHPESASIYRHFKKKTNFDPKRELDSLKIMEKKLRDLASPYKLDPTILRNFKELETFYLGLADFSNVTPPEPTRQLEAFPTTANNMDPISQKEEPEGVPPLS